jgi:uncharacterized protein with LGFP repeats
MHSLGNFVAGLEALHHELPASLLAAKTEPFREKINMPSIPVINPLGYIGVFFVIAGFFLVIAGIELIKIERLTITPGRKTWGIGLLLAVVGVLFLLPDIRSSINPSPVLTTAEAQPSEALSEIYRKYLALGGAGGFLSNPTGPESSAPDGYGRFREFQGGSIYWTPDTGAHEVHGAILQKWAQLGWERSVLGYPTTDEDVTPDGIGRFNDFQYGSIYWTPSTGAYEVHGAIRDLWAQLGRETSCLGYPISDEEPSSNLGWTRQNRFDHGTIWWSPDKGVDKLCDSGIQK